MKSYVFLANIFLAISLIANIALAEIFDLTDKNPEDFKSLIETQKNIKQSNLGKHCAMTTQEEFELSQNQITDPDLKLSEAEFIDYINRTGIGFASEFAMAPTPSSESCFLTRQEYYALRAYTGSFYRTLNSALRGKVKADIEKFRIIIKFIQSALEKFKVFEGFVKRGASMPAQALAQHVVPNEIVFYAFTSTSVGGGFSGTTNYLIQSRSCKYIAPFSKYVSEEEVLCPPGTKIKILYRDDINGVSRVVADEIPSQFNVDEFLKTLN